MLGAGRGPSGSVAKQKYLGLEDTRVTLNADLLAV